VVILRDVLAWQASEVAELLDLSVAAVNSSLQRARAQLQKLDPDSAVRLAVNEDGTDHGTRADIGHSALGTTRSVRSDGYCARPTAHQDQSIEV